MNLISTYLVIFILHMVSSAFSQSSNYSKNFKTLFLHTEPYLTYENASSEFQKFYSERFSSGLGYSGEVNFVKRKEVGLNPLFGVRFSRISMHFDTKNVTSTTIPNLNHITERLAFHSIAIPLGLVHSSKRNNFRIYVGSGFHFNYQVYSKKDFIDENNSILQTNKERSGIKRANLYNALADLGVEVRILKNPKHSINLTINYTGFIFRQGAFSDDGISMFFHSFGIGTNLLIH